MGWNEFWEAAFKNSIELCQLEAVKLERSCTSSPRGNRSWRCWSLVPQFNFSVAGGLSASPPLKASRNGREAFRVCHLGANYSRRSIFHLAKEVGTCCFSLFSYKWKVRTKKFTKRWTFKAFWYGFKLSYEVSLSTDFWFFPQLQRFL